jgi:hypothetical protein
MSQMRFVDSDHKYLLPGTIKSGQDMERTRMSPTQKESRWKGVIIWVILNQFTCEQHLQGIGSADSSLGHAFESMALPLDSPMTKRIPRAIDVHTWESPP